MKVMDKRIIISLPLSLYKSAKKLADKSYLSVSGLIRESLVEKIDEEISLEALKRFEEKSLKHESGDSNAHSMKETIKNLRASR